MTKITIYQKPTCTTCRQVFNYLTEAGINFTDVNYFIKPLTKTKLKELLEKMQLKAHDLVRKKEKIYKELKLNEKTISESEWLDLFIKYPELLQRPILEKGKVAILARPAERVKELF